MRKPLTSSDLNPIAGLRLRVTRPGQIHRDRKREHAGRKRKYRHSHFSE